MNDRIKKIAEAMGWVYHSERDETSPDFDLLSPTDVWTHPSRAYGRGGCPDPFTDANDDYAVLEWMRGPLYERLREDDPDGILCKMWIAIDGDPYDRDAKSDYQIGDYARAALKVLP